jgi:hypothetical protein
MRSRFPLIALGMALTVVTHSSSQDKIDKSATTKPESGAVEVRFADDSVVKMNLQTASIEVTTRYGKLAVPVGEIRRIEFGLRIPEETARRIDAAIARLGDTDFKKREAASADLIELRELAYAALQAAAKSDNPEIAKRAKAAIKTIVETVPAEKLQLPRHDTIVAVDFTIVGRIETESLKARTPYFGDASLKLSDVRGMRWLGSERDAKIAVDAARYGAAQEAWLDTGIDLRAGGSLQIVASGSVDLRPAPGEAGTTLSGPDGTGMRGPRGGGGFAGGGAGGGGPPGGGGRAMARPFGSTSAPGALLGRIGETGRIFFIGSRFDGPVPEDGKLYLRIVPSPVSPESTGSYDVRVTSGR